LWGKKHNESHNHIITIADEGLAILVLQVDAAPREQTPLIERLPVFLLQLDAVGSPIESFCRKDGVAFWPRITCSPHDSKC
jgi:hypothetical protein